jgi:hypothetical protein
MARLTAALAVTLGVAAACWVIAIRRMNGMGMGVSARAAIDVPVALTLVGLGIVTIIVPSAISGLVPAVTPMRPT